ncbi:MAG: hypothetical protein WAO35_17585 [Terriglobia bacterium]
MAEIKELELGKINGPTWVDATAPVPARQRQGLARLIHDFSGGLEIGKEFLTEVTERTHGDHREVSEFFSVHSVVKQIEKPDALNTP